MKFEDSYFEDEVRSGFYIDAKIKCCWAAQIEVLEEINRICQKYDISYFAEWGTLLGTIRHGGFIPWDDDMDIAMKRVDYEKFVAVAQKELPEGYELLNYRTVDKYWDVMARVVNSGYLNPSPEFLEKYHNCPYPSGIDIFPLDYIANDKEEEELQKELVEMVKTVADSYDAGNLQGEDLEFWLSAVERACNQKIDREGNIKHQLYKIVCCLYALYEEEESDRIGLAAHYLESGTSVYPKACYADFIEMPFDVIKMPVPMGYDSVLKSKYGDYMRNVRKSAGHDYPYYEKQEKGLEKKGVVFPQYEYPQDAQKRSKKPDFRSVLQEKLELLGRVHEKIELLLAYRQTEAVLKFLQEMQNIAIAIGQSIEKKAGKETEAVRFLEQYCELVYQLYEPLSQDCLLDGKGVRALLDETLQSVEKAIAETVFQKEIVFMPYRATHWKAIESVWRAACAEENCVVRVVPLPYFYKKGLRGEVGPMQYDGNLFPDYVPITSFQEYSVENNHPDKIYIQAPYDKWNYATTVHPDYYSEELWKHTQELVYIPWFKLDEMRIEDERALKSRKHFVAMPGVVYADKVIVQSEGMKRSYVEYLCEWAGEETRSIWEEKILGLGSPLDEVEEEKPVRPQEWQDKRVILYHVSGNGLLEYREKMLAKIEATRKLFAAQADKIQVIWLQDMQLKQRLENRCPEILEGYVETLENWQRESWVTLMKAEEEQRAIQLADAFYGDSGKIAQLVKQQKKPVLLQDVAIQKAYRRKDTQ